MAGELASANRSLATLDALKPRLREMLREIEATLRADAQRRRLVLGALLGDRRLRVYRYGWIDGVVELEPEMKLPAPKTRSGAGSTGGSGGGLRPA